MLEKKFRGFIESPEKHLYLSTEPYFIEKNMASGEKDLERLADTGKHEGCWVFIPEQDTWYNIVTERTTPAEGDMIISEIKTRALILNLDCSIVHYHTHPKYCEDTAIAALEKAIKKEYSITDLAELHNHAILKMQLRSWAAIQIAVPSFQDIDSYIEIIKRNPNSDFDFKIASSQGILTVKLSNTANLDSAAYKYRTVHEKVLDVERLPLMFQKINDYMAGALVFSMKYRNS